MEERGPNEVWSRVTRDRWFFGVLAAAFASVTVLFSSFGYVLLFAATTAVVSWPLFERVLQRTQGRRGLAAGVTLLVLVVAILGPVGTVVYLAIVEGIALVRSGADWVTSGALEIWLSRRVEAIRSSPWLESEWGARVFPQDFEVLPAIVEPLQDALLSATGAATALLPKLVNSIVSGGIDAIIFIFALVTLYMEAPSFLRFLSRISPMDDAYEERLFHVFREFANNMVIGSLATGMVQGLVASVGYAIAGVDRVAFMGLLTGLFSFVPIVGTAVVWVPVTLYVGGTSGWGWGLFLGLWSVLLTGTVDNVLKPLFLRGSSDIHPLLIFLAVFGGLSWMGIPGVLVGPVIVASFLALYTIYCRDYLGVAAPLTPVPPPNRLARVLGVTREAAHEPEPPRAEGPQDVHRS